MKQPDEEWIDREGREDTGDVVWFIALLAGGFGAIGLTLLAYVYLWPVSLEIFP